MKNRLRIGLVLPLCAAAAGAPDTGVADTGIVSLFPFPARDHVTLRIAVAALPGAPLELHCAIYPVQSGEAIWGKNWTAAVDADNETVVVATPAVLPQSWDLQQPVLYTVNCSVLNTRKKLQPKRRQRQPLGPPPGQPQSAIAVRFGFRSFAASGGQFLLNGRPIFLRGNSINPPGRNLPPVSGTKQFALSYLRWMKENAYINAVRIGDGVTSSTQPWYDAADEVGMLIYAGPYNNPACPDCRAKPAVKPVPAGSAQKAVASYVKVLQGVAPHPSHVILILSNENDISGTHGHWGDSPFANEYAQLLQNITATLKHYDPSRVILADAGFGHGLGGEVMDDHAYFGWYRGDAIDYFQERRDAYGPRAQSQPFTFTECVGSYLTAGGDTDVGGKNYAWSLKWTGHAPQGEGRGNRHAVHTAKNSIEIVRRFRAHNPNLAGIMPFESPFYYCGDNVTSFADLPTRNPTNGLFGPSPVQTQERTSFAPVLLSIELWTPHYYTSSSGIHFTAHITNDRDDGKDLTASTLYYKLVRSDPHTHHIEVASSAHHGVHADAMEGTAAMKAVSYYSTTSTVVELGLTEPPAGQYTLQAELRTADGSVIASNEEKVELFSHSRRAAEGGGKDFVAPAHVLLYEPKGTRTASALQAIGVSATQISFTQLREALQRPTGTVVIGENSWDSALQSLADELQGYVDKAAGRIVLLQQSRAPLNLSLGWVPGGNALHLYPMTEKIMHSGLTVGRGRPVHPTRMQHPVFVGLTREHFLSWNDANNWTEAYVESVEQQSTPDQSPAATGVFFKSTNITAEIAENEAALNRVDVLLGHGMGMQNIVLAELAGHNHGGVFFCGLGIVDRAGTDPVADRVLANIIAYNVDGTRTSVDENTGSRRLSDPDTSLTGLHPMVESGHIVLWGNYSTERGLVRTDVNGLILQPCSYDESCKMNGLGHVACGRTVLGPFSWTYMGHNTDLAPESLVGSGVVWLRTNATQVMTTFDLPAGSTHSDYHSKPTPSVPSMNVDAIASTTLEVVGSAQCEPAEVSAKQVWHVVCSLRPQQAGSTTTTETFALHFHAPKALVLRSSVFA